MPPEVNDVSENCLTSGDTMADMVAIEGSPFSAATAIAMTQQPALLRYYQSKVGEDFYTLFFLALTHQKFATESARKLWEGMQGHHKTLQTTLHRDPGVVVALCDYLMNFSGLDYSPIVIDAQRSQHMMDTGIRDALTGLFRRQVFDEMLTQEFNEYQKANAEFCLLMIDIDDFKQVNDRWGHQKGDEVLNGLGRLLLETIRKEDIAARYGGEELVILMPACPQKAATKVAERLRVKVANLNISEINITVSIGISSSHYDTATATLEAADKALYEAKACGKNQIRLA